ncbi:response regulator [Roseateles toxinivorans]|uniref:Response regulator receiver domain-containing protein n=1 Tax=Roseateles toxinivorans TaxID=270368 RepID=A0A4V3CSF6_9BURK|nr:response regulator [Roseateles toxinivorans]TDP60452.1 response regulator receiver domain-containing protein [Roseateles toxinivorans]
MTGGNNLHVRTTDAPETPVFARRFVALFVDDDAVWTLIVKEAVRHNTAIQLRVARSVAEAEASLRDVIPDVVLLDMHLGDGYGMEAFGRFKAIPGMSAVPIIALTADTVAERSTQAKALGFAEYWSKPIDVLRIADDLVRAAGLSPHRSAP